MTREWLFFLVEEKVFADGVDAPPLLAALGRELEGLLPLVVRLPNFRTSFDPFGQRAAYVLKTRVGLGTQTYKPVTRSLLFKEPRRSLVIFVVGWGIGTPQPTRLDPVVLFRSLLTLFLRLERMLGFDERFDRFARQGRVGRVGVHVHQLVLAAV